MITKIREKIPVTIVKDSASGSIKVAKEIAKLIKRKAAQNKNAVLGLATGSSPIRVYDELVRMHKEEGLSFKNVITFNLDEYYPMQPDDHESYVYFMHHHLFCHIDIDPKNVHIPDGTIPENEIEDYCTRYEWEIESAGGIDLQLLGIGRNGHIGFNEPGSQIYSKTRQITLDIVTKRDAAAAFGGTDRVPKKAITMGISTILNAQRIILMAWGEHKSDIINQVVEEEIQDFVPGTYLQKHNNVSFFIDHSAASQLSRTIVPWLFEKCDWDSRLIRKAVVWLCHTVGKPILKLTDKDYIDNGLSELLYIFKSAYDLNIQVFNDLQHTISGWPGGKPNADDSQRPERALPFPKRVVVFSPHPDDDVISMGGTLSRLVQQGHNVHVVYQTSGNLAVFDEDVLRYLDFMSEVRKSFSINEKKLHKSLDLLKFTMNSEHGQSHAPEIASYKTAIRKVEAKTACRFIGIQDDHVHFLEMPFYESGSVKKFDLGDTDIKLIINILQDLQPHQIYAAGDLSDPHGTHRICLNAIQLALKEIRNEKWLKDCYIWLYRGAWQEWDIHEVDMAVPLSPDEVEVKRRAIFKHQSQKDNMPFPGSDKREFWLRAEERNHNTAEIYDKLGLAEYQAMEVFARM
ncbi:MAG: glucosamine-6-phosphate deaminase [Bacteroidales bacterium]|jgi:glucosamine-6-phosphate deaminase|nr:glucosamine-6-phosphate deaminase [Bacteroidales bacterium]